MKDNKYFWEEAQGKEDFSPSPNIAHIIENVQEETLGGYKRYVAHCKKTQHVESHYWCFKSCSGSFEEVKDKNISICNCCKFKC